jgi:Acetyltransferase (GNAT) domain
VHVAQVRESQRLSAQSWVTDLGRPTARTHGPFPEEPGALLDVGRIPSMQVFLETERLRLRRFTDEDVENLVELDSDPDVMHFINGGRPTARDEVENELLPAFGRAERPGRRI